MHRWTILAIAAFHLSSLSSAQQALTHAEPEAGECASIELLDPSLTQEAWRNTRLHFPGIEEAVQQWRLGKGSASFRLGAQDLFWVYNFEVRRFDTVRAELMASGSLSHVWVSLEELQNGHVTTVEVDAIVRALEQATPAASRDSTKGILEIARQSFGSPPNVNSNFVKGAGDGKTHFLICDIKDGWTPSSTSGYTAGFFYSIDVDPNSPTTTNSNRRDLLYIDSYPGIFLNGNRNPNRPLGTLAHEFQHLIHWNYDRGEITFFNEGLSEYASYLCGYQLRSHGRYFNNTNITLTSWRSGDNVLDDYSRAALWTLYLGEQLGDAFIRNFTQHPSAGVAGFEGALGVTGVSTSFAAVMQSFFHANWLRSKTLDPWYGYRYPVAGRPKPRSHHFDPNASAVDTVRAQAARYIRYEPATDFNVRVNFPAGVVVRVVVDAVAGPSLHALASGSEFAVPVAIGEYTGLVLVIMNLNATGSATYSYASTGQVSRYIVEQQYDNGTPDPFIQNVAPYLGFGNNATATGFAVRFEPMVEWNVLTKARLMVMFNQEFSNGTAPADADKDFMFHVWGDNQGKPGANLITPFKVAVDRNESPVGSFVDIDLSAFRQQLTNIRSPIYIGFMEDDDDTVGTYVAVDRTHPVDVSFVYRAPHHPLNPDTWATMTEVSARNNNVFDGFNLMFRAVFEYSDSSGAPTIIPGFLQNPLFTEYIAVVATSPDRLMPTSLVGSLTFAGDTKPVGFRQVSGTQYAFVDSTMHRLAGEGAVTIRVRGTKLFGMFYADTTVVLNARFAKRGEAATIATPSGSVRMALPRTAVREDVLLTAFDGVSDPLSDITTGNATAVSSFGPLGAELNADAVLRVAKPATVEDVVLAQFRDGVWVALPTTYDAGAGELVATMRRFGIVAALSRAETVEGPSAVPVAFSLSQNYPNPFNPSTTIRFDLAEHVHARLTVYDLLGREIAVLLDEELGAGSYSRVFHATNLPSGLYFYELRAGAWREVKKLTLLR
jgi:hypothetical protein